MNTGRLLLVEFTSVDPPWSMGSETFPFIQGWAVRGGFETLWVLIGRGRDLLAARAEAPEAEDWAPLLAAARDFGPTHILTYDSLPREVGDHLSALSSAPSLLSLETREAGAGLEDVGAPEGLLAEWLGLAAPAGGLFAEREPDFEKIPLDDESRRAASRIRLVSGPFRMWEFPLVWSPKQQGVIEVSRAPLPHPGDFPADEVPERVIEQLARALDASPATPAMREVLLLGDGLLPELDSFARRLPEAAKGPVLLVLMLPGAQIVAHERSLEAAARTLAASGSKLLLLFPVERSLSERTRAVSPALGAPAMLRRAVARARELERRHPDSFSAASLGLEEAVFIFSPWTGFDELCAIGEQPPAQSRITTESLSNCLRLTAGGPAAARAAADGLLTQEWSLHFPPLNTARADLAQRRGLPWRFEDPRSAAVYALAVRLFGDYEEVFAPEKDALAETIRELLRTIPGTLLADPGALWSKLVNLARAGGDDFSETTYWREVAAHFAPPPVVEEPPEPPASEADEELEPDGPPPPAPESERDAELIRRCFEELGAEGRERLLGFEFIGASPGFTVEGHEVIDVRLKRGEEEIVVDLLPRRSVRGCFAFTSKFAVCYHQDSPVDTQDKEQALHAAVELIEEATDGG